MAELTVIRWRDIPLQLVARDGDRSARALLPERFQEAADAAAMGAGLINSDDYTEQMGMDRRPCGNDLQAEVDAEVENLQGEWSEDVLRATIRNGGMRAEPPS